MTGPALEGPPKAVPLTGVDMIEVRARQHTYRLFWNGSLICSCPSVQATECGVLAWKVKAGDVVSKGQLLGEIGNRLPSFLSLDCLAYPVCLSLCLSVRDSEYRGSGRGQGAHRVAQCGHRVRPPQTQAGSTGRDLHQGGRRRPAALADRQPAHQQVEDKQTDGRRSLPYYEWNLVPSFACGVKFLFL